jgi:hypothetical protein
MQKVIFMLKINDRKVKIMVLIKRNNNLILFKHLLKGIQL